MIYKIEECDIYTAVAEWLAREKGLKAESLSMKLFADQRKTKGNFADFYMEVTEEKSE